MKLDAHALANQVKSLVMLAVGFVLAMLLAGTVAHAARFGIPFLPRMDPMHLAYVCVAYWAIR
jgi:hypothetical protein